MPLRLGLMARGRRNLLPSSLDCNRKHVGVGRLERSTDCLAQGSCRRKEQQRGRRAVVQTSQPAKTFEQERQRAPVAKFAVYRNAFLETTVGQFRVGGVEGEFGQAG